MVDALKLGTWIAIQLACLGLSVLRLRLAAGWSNPPEAWAPEQMLLVQMIVSSLIFPWLLKSWQVGASVIATSIVFNLFAGALAVREMPDNLFISCGLIVWFTALHLLANLKIAAWIEISRAAIALWVIAGAGLTYLVGEFAGRDSFSGYRFIFWIIGLNSHPIPASMLGASLLILSILARLSSESLVSRQ